MLNKNNLRIPICSKWEELSKIKFNYQNFEEKMKKEITLECFKEEILKSVKGKKVVINAGHFIPNSEDYEDTGKNPLRTWKIGCELVRYLKSNKVDAKISLMLNDIELITDSRKVIFEKHLHLPKSFSKILNENKLTKKDILRCHWNDDEIYTEKRLSNRMEHLIKRNKLDKKYQKADSHCVSALIMYYLDLLEQGINTSVFIAPKCTHLILEKSIKLFTKFNK